MVFVTRNAVNATAQKLVHPMLMRCKYGWVSLQLVPRRCTLKLPSLLMARRSVPVNCCVKPGSKAGFCIFHDLIAHNEERDESSRAEPVDRLPRPNRAARRRVHRV